MRELTISRYTSTRRKPGPTAKTRAKRKRADSLAAQVVRELCAARDGHCRAGSVASDSDGNVLDDQLVDGFDWVRSCDGPSEWSHMHSRRRSQTRNMAPELRHDTAHSFMLCRLHHNQYDGRDKPRLYVTALTRAGADGPLKFRRGK